MREKDFYKELEKRMMAVSSLPTQKVGPLTKVWKTATPFFKVSPLKVLFLSAFIISLSLWFFFGIKVVKLVSILQFGF